ncbi:MAG: hypothetical protein V4722_02400 [Bacteroidota bacterium]
MKHFMLLTFINIFISQYLQAQAIPDTAVVTTKAGNWSDPTVWSASRVPDSNDSIVLGHNIVVDVNAFCRALNINGNNVIVNTGVQFNIAGFKPEISPQAKIIDTTLMRLISTPQQLGSGMFRYIVLGANPNLQINNIITGNDTLHYLRKITAISSIADTLELTTVQAKMSEVFTNAHFGHGIDISDMQTTSNEIGQQKPTLAQQDPASFTFNVSDRTIFSAGPFLVKITAATFTIKPNFKFDYDFRNATLKSFEMLCNNATLTGSIHFNMSLSGSINETDEYDLFRAQKKVFFSIGGLPVWVDLDFVTTVKTAITADAILQKDFIYTFSKNITTGVKYTAGAGWSSPFTINSSDDSYVFNDANGEAQVTMTCEVQPKFSINIYSVVGPYMYLGVNEAITGRVQVPSLNWDLAFKAQGEAGVGCSVTILDNDIDLFTPKVWKTAEKTFGTPYKIVKISGDNQATTDTITPLPEQIKVRVLDEKNAPQKKVPVYFEVKTGGGTVSFPKRFTDDQGYTYVMWKLDTTKKQTLEVSAKRGDGSNIINAPLVFNATYGRDTAQVIQIFNQANSPAFTTNVFKTIGTSRDGVVWAGTTNQGLYQYNNGLWTKWNVPLYQTVNYQDLKPDQFGRMWVAHSGINGSQSTNGGIICFNGSVITNYEVYTPLVNNLPTRSARSLFVDTTRSADILGIKPVLWSAHYATTSPNLSGGIGRGVSDTVPNFTKINYYIDSTLNSGGVFYIAGNSTEIWAYASNNYKKSQILRYNAENTGVKDKYPYDVSNVLAGLLDSNFTARGLYFDALGNKWMTANGEGVVVCSNTGTWSKINFPELFTASPLYNANAIAGNASGDVYFGTSYGLIVYRGGYPTHLLSSYKRYTTADGLPSDNITGISVDFTRNKLWLTTSAGIVLWDPPYNGE